MKITPHTQLFIRNPNMKSKTVYLVYKSLQWPPNDHVPQPLHHKKTDFNYKSYILDSIFYVESKYEDEKSLFNM